jgi:hypothetical protein
VIARTCPMRRPLRLPGSPRCHRSRREVCWTSRAIYPMPQAGGRIPRPDPAPDLRWPASSSFGEIRRLLQPTPHARRQPPIKTLVGSRHRFGPRPQRPQDIMACRCHHADRGDGGIRPRSMDRPRLANGPRFHALSGDAVRCLALEWTIETAERVVEFCR